MSDDTELRCSGCSRPLLPNNPPPKNDWPPACPGCALMAKEAVIIHALAPEAEGGPFDTVIVDKPVVCPRCGGKASAAYLDHNPAWHCRTCGHFWLLCRRCGGLGEVPAIYGDRAVPGETMPCPACLARADEVIVLQESNAELAAVRERVVKLNAALRDMLGRFAPNDDGLGEAEIACAARARKLLGLDDEEVSQRA